MAAKQIEVSLILSAYDKASRVINNIATKGEARLMAFAKKTDALGEKAFKNGKDFAAIGVAAAAPIFLAAQAAEESEVAVKRLNNVFKQMGDSTGRAGAQSAAYASKLQLQIGVEDEVIMLTQAKLATFKHVSNETARMAGVFDRATNAAFDMASAGFGEAANNAVQLGKALESPTQGINALRRSGITFTAEEKKKIATLEKSGQILKAQKIILQAVENQVKGAAKATATQGALTKIAYGEAMESLGRTFLPMLNQVLKRVADVINKVDGWIQRNPKLARNIVMITAAVAGLSFGISALSFVFGGLMKAMSFASTAGGFFLKMMKAVTYQNAAAGIQAKIAAISTWAQTAATNAAKIAMGAFRIVMIAVNAVLAINPFVLIGMAVIAVATLIYTNWDAIKNFFVNLWAKIKGIFSGAWDFIKGIFFKYHPLGIIIKNWDAIVKFFSDLWDKVTERFSAFIDYIKGIPGRMFEAGKNIVKSIWEGIKSFASKPIDAIKGIVKKIRDFLPFSPAKEGALRDIHKIRLVETISETIKPGPMVKAMRNTMAATMIATNAAAGVASPGSVPSITNLRSSAAAPVHFHYNPIITIQGGGSADPQTLAAFDQLFQKHKKEIIKIMEEHKRNQERTKY
jgi:phage-related protein